MIFSFLFPSAMQQLRKIKTNFLLKTNFKPNRRRLQCFSLFLAGGRSWEPVGGGCLAF
jgi:hypothetical protein